jgi:hypothetical protein
MAILTAITAVLSFFFDWQYWFNITIARFIATTSFYNK